MPNLGIELGGQLKQILSEQGLKYAFVAQAVGIPYDQMNSYLNARKPIPEIKLRCICLTFGIPVETFGLVDYRPQYLRRA